MEVLRDGLLAGVDVWVAAALPPPTDDLVPYRPSAGGRAPSDTGRERLAALGARVHALDVDPFGEQPEVAAPADLGAPVVVWDGEGALALAAPGVAGVHAALDGAWLAVRAVATAVMHPDERGGKVVLLAPRPGDPHREAARAGLENLSRTLGVEWARLGVRTVTLLPGQATADAALAELTAYLASPAGDYLSGTALTLT